MKAKTDEWLFEITSKKSLFELNFREIYQYRDLLMLFIRRDIVAVYKQTVLGPLWFVIQPILTSLIQFIVFGKIASIVRDKGFFMDGINLNENCRCKCK